MNIAVFLLFLLLLSSSCTHHEGSINGHWHIYQDKHFQGNYLTLDIDELNNPILEKNSLFGPVYGEIRRNDKELNFPGECGIFYFTYAFSRDTLILKNNLTDRYAIRHTDSLCSYKSHLLRNFRVKINFPVIDSCSRSIFEIKNDQFENLFLGRPNNHYNNSYGTGIRMVIGDKFAVPEEIPLWIEDVKSSKSKEMFTRQKIRIISDKKVPIQKLEIIIEKLFDSGIKNVYLMVESKVNPKFPFQYYKIETSEFSENIKNINDLLAC